ncbi:MAG: ribosome-associated translation inhibitor RaiA [Chthoniobacterales bacterium]
MINLPLHITTHHLRLSDPLRRFTRKKITPVARFANDALAAEIVLRRHGGAATRFSASARLALPGRDVHGRAVDPNLYVAIGKLVSKLSRLLRKRKTRLARSFTNSRAAGFVASPQFSSLALSKEESDPSADRSHARLREGGQEMRVFPFRRRLTFAFEPDHGAA